jgi:hypothetical protein
MAFPITKIPSATPCYKVSNKHTDKVISLTEIYWANKENIEKFAYSS